MLSLNNYASLKEKLYCKPHFTQLFREKGSLAAFDEGVVRPTVSSPQAEPERSPERPPPKPAVVTPTRRPEDFQSGFEPEYVPTKISKLGGGTCQKCKAKVFPIGKVQVDSRRARAQPAAAAAPLLCGGRPGGGWVAPPTSLFSRVGLGRGVGWRGTRATPRAPNARVRATLPAPPAPPANPGLASPSSPTYVNATHCPLIPATSPPQTRATAPPDAACAQPPP